MGAAHRISNVIPTSTANSQPLPTTSVRSSLPRNPNGIRLLEQIQSYPANRLGYALQDRLSNSGEGRVAGVHGEVKMGREIAALRG